MEETVNFEQARTIHVQTADLGIEQIPPAALKPYGRNARTHSKKQIGQIATSIEEFGFTNPILIDKSNTVLAGARGDRHRGGGVTPWLRCPQKPPIPN